nr:hypothetical protein [Rhodoferax sp.]
MKSRSELLAGVVCGILSLAAAPVHAFTLGELSGVALIGRSLDVTVPVQSGPGEQASAACFTAELFHADTRQPAPNVSVTPTSGGTAVVRIQANTLVDEPIVSVELRARCGSTSTRRYTLLADVAPIETQATTASTAPRLPQIERSVVKPAAVDGFAIATVGPATQARTTVNKTRAAPNPRPRPPVASVKPAVAAGTSGSELVLQQPTRPLKRSGQAVLKLDPLDVFSDRIATLDSPMLFEPSADAMLQAQQISTLEADLKTLRSRLVRSDAELLELKTQLQQSQSEQVSALWVYVLGGLVLLCLAALAWLLVLQRKARHVQEPKWHDSQQHDSAYDLSEEMGPAAEHPPAALPHKEPALAPTRPAPGELGDKAVDTPRLSDTVPAALDGVQSFSVEPILDIRQQAEFFVSLGQTDRALHILKKQIDGASQPNPFIFLDLLTLQH